MAETKGTLIIRNRNVGTKSEGNEAFLFGEDLSVYKLGREGHYPINDEYFTPFNKQDVVVSGDILEDNYINVENIHIYKNEDYEENMSEL